ncbi:unnamed protein product [Strongylus vulgaris]|uniref:Uncharacterized protein n=1 Tax=Strongylus vulgaris TaxID=40348 RepID=A0A3P7IRC6_STRVU|nr:unnamed protein product [Strongylus vulgaris]
MWTAGKRTIFGRSNKPMAHWLDRAAPETSPEMIQSVKSFINVAVIFGPLVRSNKPMAHWLDRAAPETSPEMIQSVKSFINVAVIFGPLVFFWALFDQQGSTWVLQARRLDGRIGWITVLPEQINILNPLIVIIMVPIFEAFIYPMARKFFHVTPLRKMALGGLLTATAFIMAGLLQVRTLTIPISLSQKEMSSLLRKKSAE